MILPDGRSHHLFPEIPGYRIIEQLYLGSRTAVYRAIKTIQSNPVVIKVLRREYPSFGELVQFRNQYSITKNLPIPGIVCPLSLETLGSGYALVMEDWGGIALNKYLQQQSLTLTEVLAIALQLADILHDLGQHRVVHKDIKPANILIQPESKQVKLIDFSIASLLPKETQEIQSANILEGTLAYLAPEQTGRMNRGIDYRTDFYALGVTLYQLLTGKLPFESNDPLELMHCHLAKVPLSVDRVNPDVPRMIAAIVGKLMAKNAEDRYQSAMGLKYDLERCLQQWETTGEIAGFELGLRDLSDRFLIPEKLYGRETEVQTLLAAFDRVASGSSELMLVAGFSGIGKTVVVNEVHKPIVQQRGYFIKGKFDQFNRNIPLSAFVQALRDLMGQLLSEYDAQLAQWKTQILSAVGGNGQVLIDVLPELEQIIGKQMPASELSGSAAQNRFNLLFQKFIEVFTKAEHPLVLFLDDLQWADSASLQLLKLLMNDSGYLLVLGAYRDNEVSPIHPFILTIEELKKAQNIINTITLKPLSFEDTNHLVADTLNCSQELAQPLTELIDRKTQGNPFFATQFLKGLHKENYITFNRDLRYWECDMAQVNTLSLTDDVVEFMALQLQKLPEETQEVLKLAACVGNQFDLATLAIVSERSPIEVATALWKSLQEGLILPTDQVYKFFQDPEQSETQSQANPIYRFLHDRVQQAAYSLIPEDQKQATHLKIGQLWLSNTSTEVLKEEIFEIVNQLNIGADLITDRSQIDELAQLNRIAGQKAKSANAYEAAVRYFNVALELLPLDGWTHQYNLMFDLHLEAANVEYLTGNFPPAHALVEIALKHAETLLEQVRVYEQKIQIYIIQNQLQSAIDTGLKVLEMLEIQLDKEPPEELNIEKLINLPLMTNPDQMAAMRILNTITNVAYMIDPSLYQQAIFTGLNFCIQYGVSSLAMYPYGHYSMALCSRGEVETGYQLGQLAINLIERFDDRMLKSIVLTTFNGYVRPWKEHIRTTLEPLLEAFYSGVETGELVFSGYAILNHCNHLFFQGTSLELVEQKHKQYLDLLQKQKLEYHVVYGQVWHQLILNLLGLAEEPRQLTGLAFQEAAILPILVEQKNGTTLFALYVAKSLLLYLLNAPEQALACAREAESYKQTATGLLTIAEHNFYYSLALLTQCPEAVNPVHDEFLSQVAVNQAQMQTWMNHAPMNYQHKFNLVEAERHHILGNKVEAIDLYDRAISGAKENGYIQEEALANELAAKFYLDWGKEKIAQEYLTNAYYGYAHWGAKAKVQDLEHRYPRLLAPILQQQQMSLSTTETVFATTLTISQASGTQSSSSGSTSISATLDLATVLKASQTLSSEIELDKLLATLLHTVLENAGADKGVLLMPRENQWFVEAIATIDLPAQVQSIALSGSSEVPQSLINTVKHSREPVVIIDASVHPTLAMDAYVVARQPKSLLCTPILNQGKLVAILYLENHVTVGAFTRDRVELLNFLCAQLAVSLENARLYQTLQQNELKFRAFVEDVNDMIYSVNPEAIFTYLSPQFENMWGYKVSDFLNQSFIPLIHPEDLSNVIASNQKLFESGEKQAGIEFRTRCQDGSWFWVTCNNSPIKDPQGQVIGLLGIARDIRDRKAAETALTESEAYHRNLFDQSSIGLSLCGMNGQLLYANAAYAHILGRKPEELPSLSYWDITPKKYADAEQLQLQSLQTTGRYGPYEKEYIHKDGTLIPVRLSGVIVERNGEQYIWSNIEDIRDRKAAEDALRESEQRFRDVTEAAGEYIWEIDANSIYTYITEKSKQVKGYTPAQLLGHSPIEFMPPEDVESVGAILADAVARKGSFTLQHRDILPTGEVIWEEVSGLPLFNAEGEIIGFRGTGLSITDRKAAEMTILQKKQELEQALTTLQNTQLQMVQAEKMASLGNLVAGVAHEINNPIGFLNGSISNVQEYIQDLLGHIELYQQQYPNPISAIQENAEDIDLEYSSADLPKVLDSMQGAIDRIKGISTSLRTFSRSDTEYKVRANLHDGIESTLLILKYRLKANESRPAINIIKNYGELPPINCFSGQLNQVFMNIIANAIDIFDETTQTHFYQEFELHPQSITIHTVVLDNEVQIGIRDNGVGMTEDVRAKVFDHLFTTKGVGKGTGLGLAIARQIVVEKHGGSLEVHSILGEGTEFCIRLPIAG